MAEEKDIQEEVQEAEQEKDFELEIEDDTPELDRGRQPMPKGWRGWRAPCQLRRRWTGWRKPWGLPILKPRQGGNFSAI